MYASEQQREDVVEARKQWQENQGKLDTEKLKFLDESSLDTGMTPLYGWGKKDERVNDFVPHTGVKRTSIISTLSKNGFEATMTFPGTLDQDVFKVYIEKCLVPTLKSGDIVVMDNSSVHRTDDILLPIYGAEAKVLFLPPYSPDFNPIEKAWSKMKTMLRKLKARTSTDLDKALTDALQYVTKEDIANYFSHDGYVCI
jgi:transposase